MSSLVSPSSTTAPASYDSRPMVLIIEPPVKHWRPKPTRRYEHTYDDVDESIFIFQHYGRGLAKPTYDRPLPKRDDLIVWDPARHQHEFDKSITLPTHLSDTVRTSLTSIIQRYWDSFCSAGVNRPVLDYEFAIDTGNSPPVACRTPRYGIYEKEIMMEQAQALFDNGWIVWATEGGWLSQVVLAPKPHQEHVTSIEEFVWRFCINYRPLNRVTLPFEYPIPRCEDALDDFGRNAGRLYFITLDAKSGFHQISVRQEDRVKLAFALPDGKATYTVMVP